MNELTTQQRRALRAAAHVLNPVVSISQKGLTESVLKEIDQCLKTHELIKVRVYDAERDVRDALMLEVCTSLEAAAVQHIGNILVIWREKPADLTAAATKTSKPRVHLTKKAAAVKTDKAARSKPLVKGKPRRPTRSR